jgi:hypothetical protein
MRSSLMWRSLFLSSISLAAASGCSDDSCGPMGAKSDGLLASSTEVTLTFGQMTSRAGSDCPDPDAPSGVIALTIEGKQTDGMGFITLCIPRPDLLEMGNLPVGISRPGSVTGIGIVDLQGMSNGCSYVIDKTRPPTGKGAGVGVCGNGTDSAGFALDMDGAISLTRTCGTTVDTLAVKLAGRVAIPAE